MKYLIEVDEELNKILSENANMRNMLVTQLISELLRRYVIDVHIMEQDGYWKEGCESCAQINLDWANL